MLLYYWRINERIDLFHWFWNINGKKVPISHDCDPLFRETIRGTICNNFYTQISERSENCIIFLYIILKAFSFYT
jgi:hypothetical protein